MWTTDIQNEYGSVFFLLKMELFFVMSDFADIADTSTIRQSLSRLVQSGILRRILKGVYEKTKI